MIRRLEYIWTLSTKSKTSWKAKSIHKFWELPKGRNPPKINITIIWEILEMFNYFKNSKLRILSYKTTSNQ